MDLWTIFISAAIGGMIGSSIVDYFMNPNRKKKAKAVKGDVEACAIPHPSTKWL
jgi:hypothetical protein